MVESDVGQRLPPGQRLGNGPQPRQQTGENERAGPSGRRTKKGATIHHVILSLSRSERRTLRRCRFCEPSRTTRFEVAITAPLLSIIHGQDDWPPDVRIGTGESRTKRPPRTGPPAVLATDSGLRWNEPAERHHRASAQRQGAGTAPTSQFCWLVDPIKPMREPIMPGRAEARLAAARGLQVQARSIWARPALDWDDNTRPLYTAGGSAATDIHQCCRTASPPGLTRDKGVVDRARPTR